MCCCPCWLQPSTPRLPDRTPFSFFLVSRSELLRRLASPAPTHPSRLARALPLDHNSPGIHPGRGPGDPTARSQSATANPEPMIRRVSVLAAATPRAIPVQRAIHCAARSGPSPFFCIPALLPAHGRLGALPLRPPAVDSSPLRRPQVAVPVQVACLGCILGVPAVPRSPSACRVQNLAPTAVCDSICCIPFGHGAQLFAR